MTSGLQVLTTSDHDRWTQFVTRAAQHDFYHLPAYHALAEAHEEVEARLFVWAEGAYFVALPLLLRPLAAVPCLAQVGAQWWDATSVYGYAGPIASHAPMPQPVLCNFHGALQAALLERRVATVFSRLHPLLPQTALLAGLGHSKEIGQTVSIDLTLPPDEQRVQYRKDYKRQINRLRRIGATCLWDQEDLFLEDFIEIYYENMRRVEATEAYFFERSYFEGLLAAPELGVHLVVCRLNDEVIGGGLFSLCDGLVQAHLGATRSEHLPLSPIKLVFDEVRLWGNERGARLLHLGGGVGNRRDSLFHFKTGFSKSRHAFATWQWVISPDAYGELRAEKQRWRQEQGLETASAGFFPAYRCAVCSCVDYD